MDAEASDRRRLANLFRTVSAIAPDGPGIIFAGRTFSRGAVHEAALAVDAALTRAGITPGAAVAWVARNEPGLIAAALGLLIGERCVSLINPHQSEQGVAQAIARLRPCAIVASPRDWSAPLHAAAGQIGAAGLSVDLAAKPVVAIVDGLDAVRGEGHHAVGDDIVVELLTSGTTGEPKRLPLGAARLLTGLSLGVRKDRHADAAAAEAREDLTVKRSPGILQTPMSHVGGLFRALLNIRELRPTLLRERFVIAEFVEDMRTWRPKAVSLVPAMIAMVLDADVPEDVFASVVMVRSGTAPLPVERKRAFQQKYGVPVVSEYGASEFFGGITQWTLDDHERFGDAKIASVGRPKRDVSLRVLDPGTGAEQPAGETGVLSIRSPRFGPDWIATTDLASIDADGFVYIHGRTDQAIVRGGFKVLPEQVADVFRQRADVAEACVVGVEDSQLGHVPVAVIEPAPGMPAPTPEDLDAYAREHLARYQVPVAFELVDRLPRTATMKVALGEVRARLKDRYDL